MAQLEFDFAEFINSPRENPDFVQPFPWPAALRPEAVYRKAINTPKSANLYSVIGNRIELNKER
jgi:hypothetical protein